jgi:hypothetical protein
MHNLKMVSAKRTRKEIKPLIPRLGVVKPKSNESKRKAKSQMVVFVPTY